MTTINKAPVMLITGSAKRIGAAIARSANHQGYRVIIHANSNVSLAQALCMSLIPVVLIAL